MQAARPILTLLGALAGSGTPGTAQTGTATFRCSHPASDTCFLAVFGANFSAQMFEVRGGETKQVSGVTIGRDTYCIGINGPIASTCPKKPILNQLNE